MLDINADGQSLVISEKVLEKKIYNEGLESITWEKSLIRSWLNGYDASYNSNAINYADENFIDTAFTAEEQAKIIDSNVPAHVNPNYTTINPGNATTDKIFLLSVVEAKQYFASDTDRQADATRYAVKQGLEVLGSESSSGSTVGACADVHCYASWWLRSPGIDLKSATAVMLKGEFSYLGRNVMFDKFGVRPALWLDY